MKAVAALALLASAVEAHYVFKNTIINGVKAADWTNVRKTTNYQSYGPVTDVTSSQMTCYQLAPGNQGATTREVQAGSTMQFVVTSSISHPGPLSFWMAKAPDGQTAETFSGAGAHWFKIYQDKPSVASGGITWPSQGKVNLDVKIPSCIPSGEYLLRAEHIGLHGASALNGAQLFIGCAQVKVTGGRGSVPANRVSIPGVYKQNDPGLVVNIYYPVPTNYQAPGGPALQC